MHLISCVHRVVEEAEHRKTILTCRFLKVLREANVLSPQIR